MRLSHSLLLAALLLSSACAAPRTTIRHSPDYTAILREQGVLTVLSPEVSVNTVNIGNQKERMYDYEYHLEDVIAKELTAALKSKGYEVTSLRKADIHKQQLSRTLMEMRNEYNIARNSLYTPLTMEETNAFSIRKHLGERTIIFGEKTNSNLLVLVDYSGSIKTNGARAKDFAMDMLLGTQSSSSVDGSTLIVGIVDGLTGNLLWSNITADNKGIYASAFDNLKTQEVADNERIRQLINKNLASLPAKTQAQPGSATK